MYGRIQHHQSHRRRASVPAANKGNAGSMVFKARNDNTDTCYLGVAMSPPPTGCRWSRADRSNWNWPMPYQHLSSKPTPPTTTTRARVSISITVNGCVVARQTVQGANPCLVNVATLYELAVYDIVQLKLYRASGGAINSEYDAASVPELAVAMVAET